MADVSSLVTCRIHSAVAHVRLNRPEKRNAFDDATAAELEQVIRGLDDRADVRVVVLGGEGRVFCAGGDLAWMRRVADYGPEENLRDAAAFQRAFEAIDDSPHAVVGRVQGAALGGGAGLVAVCDVVVAGEGTSFAFPEVRLGLVPGVVSTYALSRIGPGHARRLFVTGEAVGAEEACRMGLVHRVVPEADLDEAVEHVVTDILRGSPDGIRRTKALLRDMDAATGREERGAVARQAIADARASKDGREGTRAFLDRRKPRWSS